MIVVGVTGHRGISGALAEYTAAEMRRILAPLAAGGFAGISCLADGADTIFADAVLELGGRLIALIPAAGYREYQPAGHRRDFDRLLHAATEIRDQDSAVPDRPSLMSASRLLVDASDEILAVWDGLPARGHGGTADVVRYVREQGKPLRVIWPAGAVRADPAPMTGTADRDA
jgi:predicted Rossmann fold nucleotide-binding protein DprA/Smf involved in DNA uptake